MLTGNFYAGFFIALNYFNITVTPAKEEAPKTPQDQEITTKYVKIDGPKFTGQKIVLPVEKPKENKKKRTRIKKQGPGGATPAQNDPKNRNNTRGPQKRSPAGGRGRKQPVVAKQELTDEQIQKQIKETLEKLTSGKKNKGAKIRRDKRVHVGIDTCQCRRI